MWWILNTKYIRFLKNDEYEYEYKYEYEYHYFNSWIIRDNSDTDI